MKGILSGMRVVEASAFVAAPLGGMTLAQLGADVIRIDNIGGGLDYRRWPVTENNDSLFWAGLNKSKRSVALNFRSPEGAELAKQIISAPGPDAGMLLTNFPPKGWLSYDDLSSLRSDLIQLTVQGDRHGGSAVDYTVNPSIGLPFLTGPSDSSSPTNHVLPAWDLVTGYSSFPLRMVTYMGLFGAFLGFLMMIFLLFQRIINGILIEGFVVLSAVFAFFAGIQLLSIGFLGEYLGRVHHQIQERPDYIIEKVN